MEEKPVWYRESQENQTVLPTPDQQAQAASSGLSYTGGGNAMYNAHLMQQQVWQLLYKGYTAAQAYQELAQGYQRPEQQELIPVLQKTVSDVAAQYAQYQASISQQYASVFQGIVSSNTYFQRLVQQANQEATKGTFFNQRRNSIAGSIEEFTECYRTWIQAVQNVSKTKLPDPAVYRYLDGILVTGIQAATAFVQSVQKSAPELAVNLPSYVSNMMNVGKQSLAGYQQMIR